MKFGIVLLIMAMLFVGLVAFGSVNQFEVETGLTVEALMLPMEKTADNCAPVNVTYTELAIASQYYEPTGTAKLSTPLYFPGAVMAEVNQVNEYPIRLEDRLKGPLLSGPERVV